MSTVDNRAGNAASTDAQDVAEALLEVAKGLAKALDSDSGRRDATPVRKSFVRVSKDASTGPPPLSGLVARGGRGGGLIVKLYLALIWRSSGEPFTTDISARQWAALLALEDPNTKGARRIAKALKTLEENKLISLQARRGESSIVTLLDESGDESPYALPSTAFSNDRLDRDLYFKVPTTLWTTGLMQQMSSPALTMLLILLAERSGEAKHGEKEGKKVWWSTEKFPLQFGISPAMRSRGTKDLITDGLLYVERSSVANPGNKRPFASERVRNTYRLQNAALVYTEDKATKTKPKKKPNSPRTTFNEVIDALGFKPVKKSNSPGMTFKEEVAAMGRTPVKKNPRRRLL